MAGDTKVNSTYALGYVVGQVTGNKGQSSPAKPVYEVNQQIQTVASILVAIIVTLNLLVVGLEVDLGQIRRPAETWLSLDILFSVVFILEICVRIALLGTDFLYMSMAARVAKHQQKKEGLGHNMSSDSLDSAAPGIGDKIDVYSAKVLKLCGTLKYIRYFNCFDLLLVIMRLVDVTLTFAETAQDDPRCAVDIKLTCDICICRSYPRLFLKLLPTFRVVRIGAVVKHFRLKGAFRELWLIMGGFADVCKTVVWVSILLFLLLWVTAILFTNLIGHNKDLTSQVDYFGSQWDAEEYWSSCPRSLLTLFQLLTLDDWSRSITWPLVRKYPALIIPIVIFICFSVMALLNLLAGVVVESILRTARDNGAKQEMERLKTYKKVMRSMEDLFYDADLDGSGTIDLEELDRMLKMPRIRDRMQLLGIPMVELEKLFVLLDDDKEGEVPIDKFFRGCSRLGGPARASELNALSVDLARYIVTTKKNKRSSDTNNEILGHILDCVDTMEREIIRGDDDSKDPVLTNRRQRHTAAKSKLQQFTAETASAFESDAAESRVGSKRRPSLVHSLHHKGFDLQNMKFDARLQRITDSAGSGGPLADRRAGSKDSTSSSRGGSKRRMEKQFQWGTT